MSAPRQTHAAPADPRELVRRIVAGESGAEAELVARYRQGVAVIVGRMVRDSFVADDLCQETFRMVIEKIRGGELREPEKLSGFVCNLARNLAIEQMRRPQRLVYMDKPLLSAPDLKPDPLDSLLEQEKVNVVRQILRELANRRDREILDRFYLKEEDKEIICRDLGLSSLHFNRVLHRARGRFQELLAKTGKKT